MAPHGMGVVAPHSLGVVAANRRRRRAAAPLPMLLALQVLGGVFGQLAARWDALCADFGNHVVAALRLPLTLAMYSVVAIPGGVLYAGPYLLSPVWDGLRVDIGARETAFVPQDVHYTLDRVVMDLHFLTFFIAGFVWAVLHVAQSLSRRQIAVLVGSVVVVGFGGTLLTRLIAGHNVVVQGISLMWVFAVFWLSLRFVQPSDSRLPSLVRKQQAAQVVIFAFLLLVNRVDAGTQEMALLIVFVIMPVTVELCNCIARSVAREIAMDPNVGGTGAKVERAQSWCFFFWTQIAGALMTRILFTRLSDPTLLTAALVFQSAQEIILRFTMPTRDRCIRRWFSLFRPPRKTMMVPAQVRRGRASFAQVEKSSLEADHVKADKAFNAMVLVGAQLAEFAAILLSSILIYLFRNAPLQMPFDFYNAQQADFFTVGLDTRALGAWTVQQLGFELAVDFVCGIVEERRAYPVTDAWRQRPPRFLVTVFWGAALAVLNVFALVPSRDDLGSCKGQELCLCVDNSTLSGGLQSGSLRARYCEL